jgi:hypothetical protein
MNMKENDMKVSLSMLLVTFFAQSCYKGLSAEKDELISSNSLILFLNYKCFMLNYMII